MGDDNHNDGSSIWLVLAIILIGPLVTLGIVYVTAGLWGFGSVRSYWWLIGLACVLVWGTTIVVILIISGSTDAPDGSPLDSSVQQKATSFRQSRYAMHSEGSGRDDVPEVSAFAAEWVEYAQGTFASRAELRATFAEVLNVPGDRGFNSQASKLYRFLERQPNVRIATRKGMQGFRGIALLDEASAFAAERVEHVQGAFTSRAELRAKFAEVLNVPDDRGFNSQASRLYRFLERQPNVRIATRRGIQGFSGVALKSDGAASHVPTKLLGHNRTVMDRVVKEIAETGVDCDRTVAVSGRYSAGRADRRNTVTGQTVLDRLRGAFPSQYIGENTTDHRFKFGRGATIYVRKSNLNLARVLYTSLMNFPNGTTLRDRIDSHELDVRIYRTQTKTECLFESRHINYLIAILSASE